MLSDMHCVSIVSPQSLVKTLKSHLESASHLSKSTKIRPAAETESSKPSCCVIPTSISLFPCDVQRLRTPGPGSREFQRALLEELDLGEYADRLEITITPCSDLETHKVPGKKQNPLLSAISLWLDGLRRETLQELRLEKSSLLLSFPATYTVYPPLLLLPPHAFASTPWSSLLSSPSLPEDAILNLYERLASAMGVTHIAKNAPIPLHQTPKDSPTPTNSPTSNSNQNVFRFPTHLHPLHPPSFALSPKQTSPSLWVTCTQNSIIQTWAPQYTMFSRGNIREKTRLLSLPSILSSVRQGEEDGRGCSAVDLYAGIGYFTFCYRRAGVTRVLGWEISPWSVEGFRRGARMNNWTAMIFRSENAENIALETGSRALREDFIVFHESNDHAPSRIATLRDRIPPVRHVNCGLLPSSRGSWESAIRALDPEMGGWLHLHENIVVEEISQKAKEIVDEVRELVESVERGRKRKGRLLKLEHVEMVKTYAPGVMHCVLDIYIGPEQGGARAKVLDILNECYATEVRER